MNPVESSIKRCQKCQKSIVSGAAQGVCPDCLAAATRNLLSQPDSNFEGGFEAPSPETVHQMLPGYSDFSLIKAGGMGAVYRARQESLNREVAIKLLAPDLRDDPEFAQRFRQEAEVMASLSHPNIVAIHDFGEAGEYLYFVMEFVDGPDLATLMETEKPGPGRVVEWIGQIGDALHDAHDRKVIHRDMKPGNVLIDPEGRAKVADFGLAKLENAPHSGTLTMPDSRMGSAGYLAPETLKRGSANVDHRADIFAMGVMIYELLSGKSPVGKWDLLSKHHPKMGLKIDAIVSKATEHDLEKRYQDAAELASDLREVWRQSQCCGIGRLGFAGVGGLIALALVIGIGVRDGPSSKASVKTEPMQQFVRPSIPGRLIAIPRPGVDLSSLDPSIVEKVGQAAEIPADLGAVVSFSVDVNARSGAAVYPDGKAVSWGLLELPQTLSGVASVRVVVAHFGYVLKEDGAVVRTSPKSSVISDVSCFDSASGAQAAFWRNGGLYEVSGDRRFQLANSVATLIDGENHTVVDIAYDGRFCMLLLEDGTVHGADREGTESAELAELQNVVDVVSPESLQHYALRADGTIWVRDSSRTVYICPELESMSGVVAIRALHGTLAIGLKDGSWRLFGAPGALLPLQPLSNDLAEQVTGAIDVQITRTHIFALMPLE
tara:strand:- start:2352 stop:4337 length:1986 start_codon:yes stop_codon:yes gene_type:complete